MIRLALKTSIAVTAILAVAQQANAQLVTGWGYETGIVSGTLTEGVAGSFSTSGVTANAAPRAVLPSAIDFSDVGDMIQLTGTAQFTATLGNQQFRFGLYNTNGHAQGTLSSGLWTGADPGGWLGYMVQVGNGGGQDSIKGRLGTGTSSWLANADSYVVGNVNATISPPANTPYNFKLKLTRATANSVRTEYSFVGGTINRSGTLTDNNLGASALMSSFNAIGFLTNGSTGSGQFSNVTVSVPKELRLRVNTTTGGVSIVNSTDIPFDLSYYEIRSSAGALNLANWISFDDQENGDPVGTGWEEAGGSSANILSETNLLSNTTLSTSSSVGLGFGFSIGGAQDLTFSYGLPGQATLTSAFVEYVSGGVPGDYNQNNVVDTADYVVWRKGVGTGSIPNRGAGIVGNVGQADYDYWRAHFGAVTGAGADAAIGTATIPEPATAAMAVIVLIAVADCNPTR